MTAISREKSLAHFAEAQKLIPGGVNSPARAFGGVGGSPLIIDRGVGAYLYDIDGNQLIDFIGSWGPHILGHQHPAVLAAVEETLNKTKSDDLKTQKENILSAKTKYHSLKHKKATKNRIAKQDAVIEK